MSGQSHRSFTGVADTLVRVRVWLIATLLAAGSASCFGATFTCSDSDECKLDGKDGVCVLNGCAFDDTGCESGLRYHASAPGGLGGTCVPPAGTTGEVDPTTTTTTASSDPTASSSAEGSSSPTPTSTSSGGSSSESGEVDCPSDDCGCAQWVESGHNHACALRTDGVLLCWGDNESGNVGVGMPSDFVPDPTPVAFTGEPNGVSVSAAGPTCAVSDGGSMRCWGDNQDHVADPTTMTNPIPEAVAIDIPFDAVRVFVKHKTACALSDAGDIACWGDDMFGQLGAPGNGPVEPDFPLPPVDDLAVGDDHVCALAGGNVECWGSNGVGQLGVGASPGQSDTPLPVDLPGPTDQIVAGRQHTCALGGQNVWCWGSNNRSETGLPNEMGGGGDERPTPNEVDTSGVPGSILSIVGYDERTCVLTDTSEIYCWGHASNATYATSGYTFGDAEPTPSRVGATSEFADAVVQLDHGHNHMCVRTDHHRILCWGDNNNHVLGPVDPEDDRSSVEVDLACP